MTHVVVLGGTGHIGGYLVPRLVAAGHDVTVLSRGTASPYRTHAAWRSVTTVVADRVAEDRAGTFGARVAALEPDVVVDLICFTPDSAARLVAALRGRIQHFLHCGTIWVHGPSESVPTAEDAPRRPFGEYGIAKAAIERLLLADARTTGFPATILHPGHITGPGWAPINPAGNLDLSVWRTLAEGGELALPNLGLETVHHVHADDVARSFTAAMANRAAALGEAFHVVSPAALTLRGYAAAVAAWYGRDANLTFVPWPTWESTVDETVAGQTWDHIAHSPNCGIAKAERLLDFRPRYGSLEAIREALEHLASTGQVPALP